MSDGNKKPGLRDISDLKARLGMLNSGGAPGGPGAPKGPRPPGAPSNPFAPKAPAAPAPPPGAAPATPAVPAAPAAAAPAAPAMPASPAAPAGAPPPPGLSVGGDLFKKPPPRQAPPAAPAQPAARGGQADQAQLAAMFDAPSRQVLDEAPKPEAEFANPLQQGSYAQAAAPIDLTAEEEAALASFEGKQAGMKPSMAIGMTVGIGLLTLFIGYAIGDSLQTRRFLNAQIRSSVTVKDQLKESLNAYDKIVPLIMAMDGGQVDWPKVQAIPELPDISGAIFATPVPLQSDLAIEVARFVVDGNALFTAIRNHKQTTTVRDKAELEAMAEGSSFMQQPGFGVLYDPNPPDIAGTARPPVGKIVAVTGAPNKQEVERQVGRRKEMVEEYFVPVVDRQGKEAEISVRRLVVVSKEQFLTAGEANPLSLYSKRVKDLKDQLTQMNDQVERLKALLEEQANRSEVFAL